MTTINENETINEEVKTEEDVAKLIEMGVKTYKTLKNRLLRRGFIMGLLTAVAVQSLITIFMLIAFMN